MTARQEETPRIGLRAAQSDEVLSLILELLDQEFVCAVDDRLFQLAPSVWLAAGRGGVDQKLLDQQLPADLPQNDQSPGSLIEVDEKHRLFRLHPPEVLRGGGAIAVEARGVTAVIGADRKSTRLNSSHRTI